MSNLTIVALEISNRDVLAIAGDILSIISFVLTIFVLKELI